MVTQISVAEIQAALSRIEAALEEMKEPITASASTTNRPIILAANLSGLKGRSFVEVKLRASAGSTYVVEESSDGSSWVEVETIDYRGPDATIWNRYTYLVTKPYFRVSSADWLNHELEISASR